MSNHTPGPWTLDHRDLTGDAGLQQDIEIVVRYSDGNLSSHLARLQSRTLCEEHGSVEANARLIAAAPALLEALKMVRDTADDGRITSKQMAYIETVLSGLGT